MKIHIFGASGSGTTTLGQALSKELHLPHLDTDQFYWQKTEPPFQAPVPLNQRQTTLKIALQSSDWVLTGSLCGWGDFSKKYYDLAVFLWVPPKERVQRLIAREKSRYGHDIDQETHPQFQTFTAFMAWARAYDTAGIEQRSLKTHEEWILTLNCPVLRLEGNHSVDERCARVLKKIQGF